MDKLKSKEGV